MNRDQVRHVPKLTCQDGFPQTGHALEHVWPPPVCLPPILECKHFFVSPTSSGRLFDNRIVRLDDNANGK